jgi:PadR family transcriptional regulator, regulatory protein AphA
VSARRLTPTSYAVLGMLDGAPGTSYDLVARIGRSIANFWIFSHAQLYDEPARLEAAGFLTSEQEEGGRRRRTYQITEAGRAELRRWLREPTPGQTEVRDPGLLKLYFADLGEAATIAALARDQLAAHSERAAAYEELRDSVAELITPAQAATLELGLRMERTIAGFWEELLAGPEPPPK